MLTITRNTENIFTELMGIGLSTTASLLATQSGKPIQMSPNRAADPGMNRPS